MLVFGMGFFCLNLFLALINTRKVFTETTALFSFFFFFLQIKHHNFFLFDLLTLMSVNAYITDKPSDNHVMFLFLGDPEAAALLSDILRHVSKDSNPDDLSQMREILCTYINIDVSERRFWKFDIRAQGCQKLNLKYNHFIPSFFKVFLITLVTKNRVLKYANNCWQL